MYRLILRSVYLRYLWNSDLFCHNSDAHQLVVVALRKVEKCEKEAFFLEDLEQKSFQRSLNPNIGLCI